MGHRSSDTSLIAALDRHMPSPTRIIRDLGVIVLASLVFWLVFFWFGSITWILPTEAAAELAAANIKRVRLLFGVIAAMPTVIVGVLVYWLWLLGRARRLRREVMRYRAHEPS